MSTFTGTYFIAKCQVELGESRSTAAQQQAMLYGDHLQLIANEIAWNTFSVYGHVVTALVAGQSTYQLPFAPRQIRQVSVVDTNGNICPLTYITPNQAAFEFRSQWNQNTNAYQNADPEYYLVENETSVNVFPIANYNESNGLIVSAYQGVSTWYNVANVLPLPSTYDKMVSDGLAFLRCKEMQFNDDTGKYAKALVGFKGDYYDALKSAAELAKNETAWTRGGPAPVNGVVGAVFGIVGSTTWNWYSS